MSEVATADRRALVAGTVTAGLMIAQQVAARATRDALFLGRYEARLLPVAMLAGAVGSLLAVVVFSRLVQRFGPQRLVPLAFTVNGGLFALERVLSTSFQEFTIWLLYIHLAALGAVVISGFWSVYSERFDPATAKRVIVKVGAGSTLGGVVGGLLAAALDAESTLLVLVAINFACAIGTHRLGRGADHYVGEVGVQDSTLSLLLNHAYLRSLALLVALISLGAALVDFAFKAQIDAEISGEQDLLRFFAAFYAAISLATFATQTLWTRKALAKLGLAGTIALLPAGVLIFSVLGAAVTRVWSVVLLRGVGAVVENSMYRSGYELLYTPIAPEKKRSIKTIIDVAFDRLGGALGGAVVLGVVSWVPAMAPKITVAMAAVVGAAALAVAWRLHDGYVAALAESLRSGAVKLEQDDLLDATTRKTLSDTTTSLDRDRLLAEISKVQRNKGQGQSVASSAQSLAQSAVLIPDVDGTDSLRSEALNALRSGSGDAAENRPDLALHFIALLADEATHQAARDVLGGLAPRMVGQLHDALVDPRQPAAVRRRLPAVISRHANRRSVAALVDGLSDPLLEVRFRCGQGLTALERAKPGLVEAEVDGDIIHALVCAEVDGPGESQGAEVLAKPMADDSAGGPGQSALERLNRKVEHAFSLLSLVHDSRALRLCLKVIHGGDDALRGTALEYLDNVLPPDVRKALWPHLKTEKQQPPTRRGHDKVLEDLLRTADERGPDPVVLKGDS